METPTPAKNLYKRAAFRGKKLHAAAFQIFDLQCQQACLLPVTCQNLGAAAVNDVISVFKCFCLIMEARKVSVSAQVPTHLFIYLYFIFGVFLPPSRASFIAFVVFPSLGVLALEGGTLLLLLSCLLLSWCWVAFVIVPPSKVYLCYRAALIVTFQFLGFFLPAQLDPEPDNKNCPSMVQTQPGPSQPLATPDPHQS